MTKDEIARKLVEEYLEWQGYRHFQVLEVWHCYLLGNDKWLFTSTANHSPYFEITRNNNKEEYYVDVYRKHINQVWKMCVVDGHNTCYRAEEHEICQ